MTYHEAMRGVVDQIFVEEPERAALFYQILTKLKQGFFERQWVDVFFQHWEESKVSIYDAYFGGKHLNCYR